MVIPTKCDNEKQELHLVQQTKEIRMMFTGKNSMVDNHVTIIFTVPGHIINKNQSGDFYAQKCSCPTTLCSKMLWKCLFRVHSKFVTNSEKLF